MRRSNSRRNESSYKETLGIRNTDSPKFSKRCRQVREAFENKAKTKGRSYAYLRYSKVGY
jgi:hypothetical protein